MRTDKTWKVFIRMTHERESRYIPTEMYVTRKQLSQGFKIKDAQVVMHCDELIMAYRHKIASLSLELRPRNIDEIVVALTQKDKHVGEVSFSGYFEKWKDKHKELKGIRNYVTAFRAFTAFIGRNEISAADVNVKKMHDFVDSLSDRPRAASLYSSAIARVFNDMRNDYNDEDSDKILIRHSLLKFTPPRQNIAVQRGLSVEDVRRIFNLPYGAKTKNGHSLTRYNLALDCFRLSFFLMGMNAVDMYYLEEFDGKSVSYNRAKTKDRRADAARMVVDVHPLAIPIFERYKGHSRVFSFSERYASPSSFTRALNLGLKEVGKKIGVENLQFYAARHSVATIAYNDVGIPMSVVDEMLCHKGMDMQITKLYIKKDFSHVNTANFKLIDYVIGGKSV